MKHPESECGIASPLGSAPAWRVGTTESGREVYETRGGRLYVVCADGRWEHYPFDYPNWRRTHVVPVSERVAGVALDDGPDDETDDPGLAENPKEAIGLRKPPTSTLPWGPLVEVGQAMSEGEVPPLAALHVPTLYQVALGLTEGALKYGRHNYRVAGGILASVYFDATNRHLDALLAGQDIDPDSGLYHGVKAICSTLVLRDSMIQGSFRDNRPPRSPFDFNEAVSDIVLQDSVLHLCGEAKFAMARWWEGGKPENVIYALTFLFRLCEKHYTGQLADDRAWLDPDFLDKIEQGLNEILLRLPPEKRVPEWTQERLTPTPGVD